MLTTLKERLGRDEQEEGFTLIELMVVVLIIAILLAIAIPTFLGARNSANARAAQSNIRNALTAEQTYYTNNQSFSSLVSDMTGVEPNLGWTTTPPSTSGNAVGITAYGSAGTALTAGTDSGAVAVLLQSYGQDGNCYDVLQLNSAISTLNAGTYYAASPGACAVPGTFPTAEATGRATSPTTNIKANPSWYASW